MKAIVAVDLNWAIGCGDNLLERIPEDMAFFKQMTLGKIVVMGRGTFESLPGQQPLKNRINIILSKNRYFSNSEIIICRSLNELSNQLEKYPTDDVFVIGGQSIYTQLLPYCTEVYVTKIENRYRADKYFVNLDKEETWEKVFRSEFRNYNNSQYRFERYVNIKKCNETLGVNSDEKKRIIYSV